MLTSKPQNYKPTGMHTNWDKKLDLQTDNYVHTDSKINIPHPITHPKKNLTPKLRQQA